MGERGDGRFPALKAEVIERSWDVSDPAARLKAAREKLGEITEQNRCNAMWMIDAERNAAALLIFRPDSFECSTIEKRQIDGELRDVVVVRKFGEPILVPFSEALLADYGEDRTVAMCEDLASRAAVS
jgi:hypothetical protein